MPSFARLAHGAAWSVAGKLVQLGVTLVALVLVARRVGPQAYGVFALTWVAVGLLEVLVTLAPIDTLVQRRKLRNGHLNVSFWASLALGAGGWLALHAAAAPLARWLDGGAMLESILPFRALSLPIGALAVVPVALLTRASRFKAIAGVESGASVVASATGIALAVAGAGVWSLVAMELVRSVATAALAWRLAPSWRPRMRMRPADFTELFAFNASTWLAWGIAYVDGQLPRAMIGRTLGPAAVGLYSLARRLYDQIVTLLIRPAYQVVQAGVARAQDDVRGVAGIAHATMRASAVLACPVFLGMGALAPVLVPLAFGPQWVEAVPVVQAMMLFAIRSPATMVQMAVVRGMGKAHWHLGVSALGAGLTLLLVWLALPHGIVGVALAAGLRGIAVFPVYALLVRRLTGLSVRAQAMAGAGAFAAGLLTAVGTWSLIAWLLAYLPDIPAMIVAAAAGGVLYTGLLGAFSPAEGRIVDTLVGALARRDFPAIRRALATGGTIRA